MIFDPQKNYFVVTDGVAYETVITTGDKLLDVYGTIFWGSPEEFEDDERELVRNHMGNPKNWYSVMGTPVRYSENHCDGSITVFLMVPDPIA